MQGSRVNAALFAAVVVLGLTHIIGTAPRAAAQQGGASQTMFAVVAPGQGQGNNVLFVIDPESTKLLVYEHRAGGKLEMVHVRNIGPELGYDDFTRATRDLSLSRSTAAPEDIVQAALVCLDRLTMHRRIRLLGVKASNLERGASAGNAESPQLIQAPLF